MSQQLARIEPTAAAVQSLADIQQISKLFAASGMFADVKGEAQAAVKIMAGAELGLSPFVAMSELHVIQGKITMSAGFLAKRVKESGRYNYRIKEHTDKICTIEFFEHGEPLGVSAFTIEDAKRMQVKNLDKFPKNMLFARAISNGVRFYCPDVTGQVQVYSEGEIDSQAEMRPLVAVQPASDPLPAVEAEFVDCSTYDAIRKLWPDYGIKKNGHLLDLNETAKTRFGKPLDELAQPEAETMLEWLQTRANAIAEETAKEAA